MGLKRKYQAWMYLGSVGLDYSGAPIFDIGEYARTVKIIQERGEKLKRNQLLPKRFR